MSVEREGHDDPLVASFHALADRLDDALTGEQRAAVQQFGETLRGVRREQALTLRRYRLLFEEAPDPYLVTDAESVIREANAAARDLFGSDAPLEGTKLVTYVVAHQRKQFEGWIEQIRAGAPDARWHTTLDLGADGIPIEISLADDLDEIGYRWVLRDERERTAAEKQLWQVAQREHRAASELRTDDRLKTGFLISLSHDLRGPIGALVHQAELLNTAGLSEQVRQRSQAALEDNATMLATMLDALVEIERFALGELKVQRRPTPVVDVVQQLDTEDDSVTLLLPDEPLTADLDADALRRALRTLLQAMRVRAVDAAVVIRVEGRSDRISITLSAAVGNAARLGIENRIDTRLARTLIELHGGQLTTEQTSEEQTVSVHLPTRADAGRRRA